MQDTRATASPTLADILTFPVVTIAPGAPLPTALTLMCDKNISALVVTRDEKPIGIVTERDAVLLVYRHEDIDHARVREVMSSRLVTAPPEMDYREGYRRIMEKHVRHLIVQQPSGELTGIVTEGDFLKHLDNDSLIRFKEVGAVMSRNVLSLPDDTLVDDAISMMVHAKVSCIVVESGGQPRGIFTERDLVRLSRELKDVRERLLASVMVSPVVTVSKDTPLPVAVRTMDENRIRHLVCIDDRGTIVGLVSRHDILKILYDRHVKHFADTAYRRELEQLQSELQTEHALRHTKDLLAESQRLARIGSWELNLELNRLWWSDETYRIFEIDPASFGANYEAFIERVHPDDRAAVDRTYKTSLDEHAPYDIVHRLLFSDGRVKTVREVCATHYDENGVAIRSIGTVQDLTENRQEIQEKRQLSAILEALVNGSSDAIFVKDLQGCYVTGNLALADLLNTPLERIIGADDFALFPKALAERFRNDDRRVLEQGRPETYQEDVIVGNKVLPHLTTKGPLIMDGEVRGVFGISRDISSLKQTQDALRKSESRYRNFIEHTSEGIYSIETDTPVPIDLPIDEQIGRIAKGRVVISNQAFARMQGHTDAEALTGLTLSEIHGGEERQEHIAWLADWIRDGYRVQNLITSAQDEDGHAAWRSDNLIGVVEAGRLMRIWGSQTDVTERVEAERQLRTVAYELRRAQAVAHIGNWSYRVGDGRIEWSDELYRIFGRDPKSTTLTYADLISWIHPNDRKPHDAYMQRMLALAPGNDPLEDLEYRLIRPDGSERWARVTFESEFDEKGNPSSFFGTLQDITEQKRAELRLSENEARFRTLYRKTPVMMHAIGTDFRLQEVSDRWLETLGYEREDVIGHDVTEFETPETSRRVKEDYLPRLMKTGRVRNAPLEIYRKNGEIAEIELDAIPEFNEDGTFKRGLAFLVDVTDRNRARSALRETEEKFRAIFDNTNDGILVADAGTRRFSACNPAICDMLGYSEEEVLRLGVSDIHPKDDLPHVIECFEKQAKGELNLAENIPVLRKDGSVLYADISGASFSTAGTTRMIGAFRDITERRKAEDDLAAQLRELQRWEDVTLGREKRVLELKREINQLLTEQGQAPRYSSVDTASPTEPDSVE